MYPSLGSGIVEGRGKGGGGAQALPSVTLPLVPQSGDLERTGGLWKLEHRDRGVSCIGPGETGSSSWRVGQGNPKAGLEQCGSLGWCLSWGRKEV